MYLTRDTSKVNDEIIDTGYGFINDKGVEVCTDNELEEVD